MTREEAARACPIATAFVKQMREVFGDKIEVLGVMENGHLFGDAKNWKEETKDEAR